MVALVQMVDDAVRGEKDDEHDEKDGEDERAVDLGDKRWTSSASSATLPRNLAGMESRSDRTTASTWSATSTVLAPAVYGRQG